MSAQDGSEHRDLSGEGMQIRFYRKDPDEREKKNYSCVTLDECGWELLRSISFPGIRGKSDTKWELLRSISFPGIRGKSDTKGSPFYLLINNYATLIL